MPSYIIKATPDEDFYVMWSTIVDADAGSLRGGPAMTADHVAALAEVLAEHADVTDRSATDGCSCGYPDPRTYERHAVEAILDSPAMRDLLAGAWDAGWQTRDDDGQWPNPYRGEREQP